MGTLTFRAAFVSLLIAVSANAQVAPRRHAIGWPFPLPSCAPGIVTYASEIEDFTLAGADIYFADDTDVIWRVPKVGGTSPVRVVRAPGTVLWMKVEDSRLYFAAISGELTADIYFVLVGGETITTVASGLLTPIVFKTDGQFIYALSIGTPSGEDFLSDGSVRRVAKTGGTVQTLASGLSFPLDLALRGNSVYYGEAGIAAGNTSAGLRRIAADGSGAVVKLFDGGPVISIAVDDTNAYFVLPKLGTGLVEIDRIPLAGGTATPIVTGLDFADGLTIQRGNLYYNAAVNELSSIDAISIAGGAPRTVKDVETWVSRLEFDECLIYYATDARIERATP